MMSGKTLLSAPHFHLGILFTGRGRILTNRHFDSAEVNFPSIKPPSNHHFISIISLGVLLPASGSVNIFRALFSCNESSMDQLNKFGFIRSVDHIKLSNVYFHKQKAPGLTQCFFSWPYIIQFLSPVPGQLFFIAISFI